MRIATRAALVISLVSVTVGKVKSTVDVVNSALVSIYICPEPGLEWVLCASGRDPGVPRVDSETILRR